MLFLAGLLAGVTNAIAGGGTFFTFPAFLATGLPPIVANASNCIAVWPGHALAVVGYRSELRKHTRGLGKSVYIAFLGGGLGAGLGVMLMAGLHMLGVNDIQANNALKNVLATMVTSVALIVFTLSGIVAWPYTLVAFTGAAIGGLLGARIAQWLPAIWFRRVIIIFGMFLTVYYFIKFYG